MKARGMTLLELLVALTLLSVIAVAGYRGTDALIRADGQLADRTVAIRTLDADLLRMEDDFRHALLSGWQATATPLSIQLLRVDGRRGEIVPVLYRENEGRFERLSWNTMAAYAQGFAADATTVLTLSAMEVQFLDAGGAWHKRWPDTISTTPAPAQQNRGRTSPGIRAVTLAGNALVDGSTGVSLHRFFEVGG